MKTAFATLIAAGLLVGIGSVALAQTPPEPLAHFRFDGNANNEVKGTRSFFLKNTEFRENALYLNGKYDFRGPADAYKAYFLTESLDYNSFAVALRFKAEDFTYLKTNLITGGSNYRWFSMGLSPKGNLMIALNNGRFKFEADGAVLAPNKWMVAAFSMDLASQTFLVTLDGILVGEGRLPDDFVVDAASLDIKGSDKRWFFTNYSNARVFHGLVDELIIYGRGLSEGEIRNIPLRP